ncbi:MAG: UDP-N-acetylmuramate dehydrogenase [Candidatus Babeliales bacterium]
MLRAESSKNTTSIPAIIQQNISLADKNWFATGGAAKFFCEPTTPQEFQQALQFANEHKLLLFILGAGANILIADEGFDGLVIRPKLTALVQEPWDQQYELLTAGAGVQLDDLIEYCLAHNLSGLEEFSGIPGTVGGAVYINLHYFEFLLDQFLVSAQIIEKDTGVIKTVDPSWFDFGYNQSTLLKENHFLLSATFKLKKINPEEIAYARGRKKEIIRHRAARYPQKGTCGSFFRNFHEHEVTLESNGKKMIYVAYYLDKIGVKGALQVGGATVSHQHANMLVNRGNATSADIIQLARTMQKLVFDQFGILPQPECRLVGFKEYPLLK